MRDWSSDVCSSDLPEYTLFDRGGPGPAYNPREEDPFLIPGAYVRGNLSPSDREFKEALGKARDGSVCVLIYHGVPDVHPHCSTSIEMFTKDMQYLKDEGCTVIALRDLAKYVDFSKGPKDIYAPIMRSEEHTSELQSRTNLVCRLLLEKKKKLRSEEHRVGKE